MRWVGFTLDFTREVQIHHHSRFKNNTTRLPIIVPNNILLLRRGSKFFKGVNVYIDNITAQYWASNVIMENMKEAEEEDDDKDKESCRVYRCWFSQTHAHYQQGT